MILSIYQLFRALNAIVHQFAVHPVRSSFFIESFYIPNLRNKIIKNEKMGRMHNGTFISIFIHYSLTRAAKKAKKRTTLQCGNGGKRRDKKKTMEPNGAFWSIRAHFLLLPTIPCHLMFVSTMTER